MAGGVELGLGRGLGLGLGGLRLALGRVLRLRNGTRLFWRWAACGGGQRDQRNGIRVSHVADVDTLYEQTTTCKRQDCRLDLMPLRMWPSGALFSGPSPSRQACMLALSVRLNSVRGQRRLDRHSGGRS